MWLKSGKPWLPARLADSGVDVGICEFHALGSQSIYIWGYIIYPSTKGSNGIRGEIISRYD